VAGRAQLAGNAGPALDRVGAVPRIRRARLLARSSRGPSLPLDDPRDLRRADDRAARPRQPSDLLPASRLLQRGIRGGGRQRHQPDDDVPRRPFLAVLRRPLPRQRRDGFDRGLAAPGRHGGNGAAPDLVHHSQRFAASCGRREHGRVQSHVPDRHDLCRGVGTSRALPIAEGDAREPGAAGGHQGVAGKSPQRAQGAGQLQVAAVRQHHARVQDAAGDGAGTARADPAGRDGRAALRAPIDVRVHVPQRPQAAEDDRRSARSLASRGIQAASTSLPSTCEDSCLRWSRWPNARGSS